MAGRTAAGMIPDLTSFRPEWLDTAEVSCALAEPQVTGLSFFFHDEASCTEFTVAQSLDECVMADEKVLRSKFDILPRHWLKIHYDGMERCGLSHYFYINPTVHYPITTIRCFLRSYGLTEVAIMEELLKPALEARETQWGLAIKRFPDLTVPRIFFSIERVLLNQTLTPFVTFGYLSATAAEQYRKWNSRISAGESVFISLDPAVQKLSSIDFCDVASEQLGAISESKFPHQFDYLKIRISEPAQAPTLTGYLPLSRFHGRREDFDRLVIDLI